MLFLCFVLAFESLSIAAAVDEPDNSDQQQTIAVKDISGNNNLVFSIAGMEETQDELAYNLSLDFMVENPQGDYKVNPGDKFSFSLPSDIFTAEDTQEAVAIYSESSASFGDIKTEVKGEKIAEYTVKSQVVEVVFCDYIEQVENVQSLFGRIMIKINLMRKALTFEEQKSKWDIQTLEDGTVRSLEIQLPARQTVEWTERTEQFSVSQTDNGENEKTVQFSFNESKDKFPPMEGDTAVIAVGEEWQIKSEKIDAEPAEAENAEESEAEKSVVTNYLLVEGNTEPFALYKLENGNLVITFEKEVENIDDISKINGQISLEKIPEPTEEETAETTEEITTEEGTEPATEETTETEPTEKPSEAVSNSVSNSDVSLLADDYDIDENGVLIKFTAYNSQAEEQDIYWIDNNNSNNVRPDVDDVKEQLYNNVKFTATYTYTENNEEHIGTFTRTLAELGVDKSKVTVTDLGGTNHYVFNVASSGLPSAAKITVEDKTYENIKLTWDYTLDTELYRDQYYYVDVNENTVDQWPSSGGNFGWYFSKSMDYSIDIEVRHGQQAMYGIDEVIADLYHFYYVTNVYVGGELVEDHSAISDLTSRNDIVWGEWDYDTNTFKGTNTFTVKHLPMYNLDGSEILYYIDRPEEGEESKKIESLIYNGEDLLPGDDYLLETVENDLVSNFGTDTERVHTGGLLILTRTGYKEYNATKEWHDEADSSTRPRLEFQLWRVAYRPGDDLSTLYQSATPVKDKTDKQTATFVIEANSTEDTQQISFEEMFNPIAGIKEGYLPKYDKEGYPYIYFTREYMSGEGVSKYKVVYGSVQPDGTIKDTLLYDQTERDGFDNSIYNGGTVSNILIGNVTASVEKIWDAAAFQSALTDVRVVLKLQCRPVDADQGDEDNWVDTEITHEMDNFIAENLEQSYSQSMSKYDNFGRELEYRWVEEGIYQGEDSDTNLLNSDGSFILNQNGYEVYYNSTLSMDKTEAGVYHTSILNKIEDKTEVIAIKEWSDEIPIEQRTPVELMLYRAGYDSTRYPLRTISQRNFEIDGNVDEEPTPLYIFADGTGNHFLAGYVQETEPWKAHFTELDRYDKDGHPYDYILLEGARGNWYTDYSTTTDDKGIITTVITNSPPVVDSFKIYLRKRWIDDGDAQHREDVTYTIYCKEDDGSFTEIAKQVITAQDNWWKRVNLNAEYKDKKLLVLETQVGNVRIDYFDQEGNPMDPGSIEKIFNIQNGINEDSPFIQYETDYHKYEATYMMVQLENLNFYTVSNRRLGNIDITVEKNWVDGEDKYISNETRKKFISDLEDLGYKLVLKLEFAPGYEDKGYIDYEENTVTMVNEKEPIKDDNNNYVSAVQDVSKETANSTYYFWNLPKYDEFGTLVSYQVTEYVYDEAKNEYYSLAELKANGIIDTEYNSNSYQVSYELSEGQHKNDKQRVAVTNGLSGSKEIFFRKEWKDAYRYKNGERPDIYLDLYRVIHVKDEEGNVVEKIENIYLDSKWSFHNDVNYSTCNFGSMPKYDSLGYEIFYYAREKMRINKEIFDYTEVEYKYWEDPSDDSVIDEEHPNWEEYRDIGTEYGGLLSTEKDKTLLREYVENGEKVYLLKERGMFVNKIAANVTIDGKKIWANLPSGFLQADLPEVKFSIYQFIEDTDPGNDEDLNKETLIATLTVNDWSKQLVNGEYHFMISYDGENTNSIDSEGNLVAEPVGEDQGRLPKYDDNGELHIYRLREEVIGLNGSDANDINLVFKQPVINNYAITNGYNPQLGSISVRKWLDTTPFNDDEEKPTIYFALTRTYKNDEGNVVSDPHFIQVMKMDYKDFVNGVADITFKDLPIYAPNGNYYTYKVAENANKLMQGGYDMTAGIGFLAKNSSGYTVSDVNDDGIVEVDGLIPIKNNDDGTIPDPPERPNSNLTNWATFKNVYNTGDDASLYFGKEWVDNNNKNGSRPKTLTFEIYRSADAQSGQGNAISETKIGTFTVTMPDNWNEINSISNNPANENITIDNTSIEMVKNLDISVISASGNSADWTGTGDFATSKYWLFQLEGLEIYAPNSMPWKYKITEIDTGLNGYNIAIGSDGVQFTYSKGTNSYNTMGNAISKLFKNSVEASYTMWKNWRKDIGDFQNSTNKTGYNIKLDSTLYVAGVQAESDGTAPDAEQYNNLDLWKTVTSSEFKDILSAYNVQENRSVTINNGATLGAKNAANRIDVGHLPVTVMYNGNVYYLKYYMIESKLSFINSSNTTVYYEKFTPTFKLYDEKGKDYPDVSRIGFYLDTQSYILKDTIKHIYEETALNIFEPVVSSEEILNNIHYAGLRSVYTNTQDSTTDKSIYPYINFYDGNTKKESTFVNLYGETNLKAEKTWVDDADNIYGTREPNGDGWKIVFNIQYKDKNNPSSSWENFKYGSNAAAITITGENSEDNKSNTVTNLPVLGVLPNEDNTGYDIVEFEYCAREVYNSIVINNEEIYRDTYEAIYDEDTQPDAENNLYTSSVTNDMITIELEATKNWEDTYGEITPIDMISPVTFELQYQDTNGQWTSFNTPAKVTLNGEPDDVDQSDLPACYEDIAWHAVWNFVPKVMPGSATTGEGDAKQTIYRIVETSENAYPTDGDTELNKDNTDPTKENAYSITNELTELKIEKVVEKYVDGAVVNDKFIFTISGDMDNINLYYKKYNKGDGAAVQDELAEQGPMVIASGKTNFELSDNQYIVIYGLKKGKTYTITENSGKYTAFYKVNNGTETEGNTASVTIPNSKPADMDYVLFTNKRFGKITINKVDENDKKLNGATFLLEKKVNDSATGTESWEEVERKVTGADGVDGVAVFDKLDLNVNYKITELSSADGYNKLINPIKVYLPLGSDTKGENPLYDTEINGLYYYAEITYTIGNNASLEIPTTGGSGFFNPGILGVSALILVAFFYVIREDRKRRKAKSKL